ncbi:MAG: hypothetical protein IPJ50_16210 [Betaproteobacteria bacterium]|nr:hypothetical protein [Betaproteobacteria bacterium]
MKNRCSAESAMGFVPKRLPFAYSAITIALLMVAGCATQKQGGAGGSSSLSSDIFPDARLREVYVLGSVRNAVYDDPNKRTDPLLNPRTPPPPFKEQSNLTKGCSPSTKLGLVDDYGTALVDEARFQQLMVRGTEIAQARHIWKFNVERNEAQLKKVSGPRTAGRNGRAVEPRPSSVPSRSAPVRPDTSLRDLTSWLKPNSGRSRPGLATADEINSQLPNFAKMQDDLAYNAQILATQDEALKNQEREYTEHLMALYQDAFSRFSKTPQSQLSRAVLNRFDSFRFRSIFTCTLRGESTEKAKELSQAISNQYVPIARNIIESNRSLILQAIKAAKSSSDLQIVYQDKLSTEFLLDLAAQDQAIAQGLQQRTTALLAQEAHEREEARKRAEAEAVRQVMLLKKKYLQNAANNVAPTVDDVRRLVSIYESEVQQQYRGFRTERTGLETFDYYAQIPLFGEIKGGTIETGVVDLTCKPEQNHQRCSFAETRIVTIYNLGLFTYTHEGESSGKVHETNFYWDASGLHSPQLKTALVEINKRVLARLEAEAEAQRRSSQRQTCTRYYKRFGSQVGSYEDCY